MRRGREARFAVHVGLFAVVADIQANRLVVSRRAQRNNQANHLQENEADNAAIDDGDGDCSSLNADLAGLPKSAPSAMPFSAFCANTPVNRAPTVPPTPCAATTSSESSSEVLARQMSPK